MEVKGEYMAASLTVGGGRKAIPPPLALCQSPFSCNAMVSVQDAGGVLEVWDCLGVGEGVPRYVVVWLWRQRLAPHRNGRVSG
jgi:hypothetical protein